MPRLAYPEVPDGPHRLFVDALHDLHLHAGLPSLRVIKKRIEHQFSVTAIHKAFSSDRLPAWPLVEALARALVPMGPTDHEDPEPAVRAEVRRFHKLWASAQSSVDRGQSARAADQRAEEPPPDPRLVARLYLLLDCSAAMGENGRLGQLNFAVREMAPELQVLADEHPGQGLQLRAMTFDDGARWHMEPRLIRDFTWRDLQPSPSSRTDLNAALTLLNEELSAPSFPPTCPPPTVVLILGSPLADTEWLSALKRLNYSPWGPHLIRLAMAVGDDASHADLCRFLGPAPGEPLDPSTSQRSIPNAIRWAPIDPHTPGPGNPTVLGRPDADDIW